MELSAFTTTLLFHLQLARHMSLMAMLISTMQRSLVNLKSFLIVLMQLLFLLHTGYLNWVLLMRRAYMTMQLFPTTYLPFCLCLHVTLQHSTRNTSLMCTLL